MALTPVEAVVFWRYGLSVFKAVYGRYIPPDGYSKNYLQTSGTAKAVLDQALHRGSGENVTVTWKWPGGSLSALWKQKESDPRGELYIRTVEGTVRPFMLGDPDEEIEITIPGTPGKATSAEANAEWETLKAQDLDPWIVAIKLRGEDRVLHARAYLGNPPDGQQSRGINALPPIVRQAIANQGSDQAGGILLSGPAAPRAPALVARIKAALARDPNVLLVGPPGTGKTVALEDLRAEYDSAILFDPDRWEDSWRSPGPGESNRRALGLVFHPSYTYENFVAGLVPAVGAGLSLSARPGPLVSLAQWAAGANREALLIIDEFNRGPAAAIFGDTLALLDADKRDRPELRGAAIERPFADHDMNVSEEFRRVDGSLKVDRELRLPSGVHIVAAMNSTDRSVAPIDAALRRRFAILRVDPDYQVLAARLSTSVPDTTIPFAPSTWTPAAVRELAMRLIRVLNERIELVLGPDFLMGHALLWNVRGETLDELAMSLLEAFEQRVAATLRLTFTDQDEALAAVLSVQDGGSAGAQVARWRSPTGQLSSVSGRRLHFEDLSSGAIEPGLEALRSILSG